tara:strand:- start:368 stop:571 length:204 start_codon:yes stop_codon:yes gene_type:complete
MIKDTLVNRLRGIYAVGPNAEFGSRSFGSFGIVAPISLEAANRIEELEQALDDAKMQYLADIGKIEE